MGRASKPSAGEPPAAELREALERTLEELDQDDRRGPLLNAADLCLRIDLSDTNLVLDIAASEDAGHHLEWSFSGDLARDPKLVLSMTADVANRWLQGDESLAIAIARGKVRCSGETRAALVYLPAAKLITEPYRRVVSSGYPHLALH
jgi:hypothetical protein